MAIIYPVILSGGSGTRLWPISRSLFPKQFLSINGSYSFFQETILRFNDQASFSTPTIICNSEHRFIVAQQLSEIDIVPASIILEPVGRNTAAAAAIAAMRIHETDPNGLVLLLASDHKINKPNLLSTAILNAIPVANEDRIVTFGINPNHPETGFGYIKIGAALEDIENCYGVDTFVEKPDLKRAEEYISSGNFLWNSSLFLFRPNSYLEELSTFESRIKDACRIALDNAIPDLDFLRLDEQAFAEAPSVSIDYAVMERTSKACVMAVEPGWSDVGSWTTLWDISEKDENQNTTVGDVILSKTKGTIVHANSRLVAVIGVEDLVIAETPDAVLVLNKKDAQEVKQVVELLNTRDRTEGRQHTIVHRPWGNFETIISEPKYQVKRINVNSGSTLSLQTHEKRSEHWVVIEGIATVTRGLNSNSLEVIDLYANQSIDIPLGWMHRLENKQKSPLIIIEVQSGDYLGEDDIERYEDIYGRASKTNANG